MIRLAAPADEEELLALIRDFNEIDQHPQDYKRVRLALRPLLFDDSLGVVYVWGEPIEGYCVATWSYSLESGGRDGLIDEFYTRECGLGIGGAAFGEAVADLKRRGIPRLFLETEAHNEQARASTVARGWSKKTRSGCRWVFRNRIETVTKEDFPHES